MSNLDRPNVSPSLAESLSADLNDHRQSAPTADDTIRELEAFIARVPPRTDLYNTRKHFYVGIFCTLVLGLALWAVLAAGGVGGGAIAMLAVGAAFGIGMIANHWNAGRKPEATFTHTELTAPDMARPLQLADVVDIEIAGYFQVAIHLDVESAAQLPVTRKRRGFYLAQAIAEPTHAPPRLTLMSSGVRVNAKTLDDEQTFALIADYVNVARAHRQLAALRAGHAVSRT
jgi:hypothetical protein